MSADAWYELATREYTAAQKGGAEWRRFVGECELRLGQPWDEIREGFNAIHQMRAASVRDDKEATK